MKKFNFHLEGLLTLRDWEEQVARQKLGEITSNIRQCREEIGSVEDAKSTLYTTWSEGSKTSFSPMHRIALDGQIVAYDEQLRALQARMQEAEQKRMGAIESLKTAARAKKVVENFKDKRLEEFRAEFYRQEAREIEDIFNSRYKGAHS